MKTVYALEEPYIAYSVDSMRILNISILDTSMRVWQRWVGGQITSINEKSSNLCMFRMSIQ